MTAVTILAVGAVAVSQFKSQNLYQPGSELRLSNDLLLWEHPALPHVPEENRLVLEEELRDAGLIDADGNVIAEPDG